MVQTRAAAYVPPLREPPIRECRVPPGPPPDQYHLILECIGLSDATIRALENRGLDHVVSFHDITEKDIPFIVNELQ
jgi:hypothetical protein